jgi:hypothetical protein
LVAAKDENDTNPLIGTSTASVSASAESNVVAPNTKGSMTVTVNGQAEVLSEISAEASGSEVFLLRTADVTTDDDGKVATSTTGVSYFPVKWSLTEDGATVSVGSLYDVIAFLTGKEYTATDGSGLKSTIDTSKTKAKYLGEHNANEEVDHTYVISWEWAFEQTTDVETVSVDSDGKPTKTGDSYNTTKAAVSADLYDTVLGNLVADKKGSDVNGNSVETTDAADISQSFTSSTTFEFNLEITIKQIQALTT